MLFRSVFKMMRTGFSGPVPLASPSAPSPAGAGDALTTPLTATHTTAETASGSRSGMNPVSLKEAQRQSDASKKSVSKESSLMQNLPPADGLDRHHPIELIESDAEMADSSTSGTHTPAPAPLQTFTPLATQPKENAFDDKSYRSWTGTFEEVRVQVCEYPRC